MKIFITLVGMFFSVVFAVPGYADSSETVLLFSVSNKKIARIGAINRSDKIIHLSISNQEKDRFFDKGIKPGESYFEFHDLSKLPDGEYVIELGRGKFIVQKEFKVQGDQISVISPVVSALFGCSEKPADHKEWQNSNSIDDV